MKAAVFHAPGKPLALETLPDPVPRPGDVVIRVHRCGICGTDLSMTQGEGFLFPLHSVIGHEYAGEVVEIGSEVEGLRKGDLITAVPGAGCGRASCHACMHGNATLCPANESVMGGFGEYMRIPARVAVKLPSVLSLADGALVEPLAVGLHGLRVSSIRPGDRVLVQGGGSVALAAVYWARRLGALRVVAASRSMRRKDMALAMGADAFVQTGDNEVQEVAEALGGPPDIVFECVGVPGLLMRAIEHVRTYGEIVSLGFCTSPDMMIPAMAAFKAVRMSFPVGYSLRDFEYVADVMDAGHADPKMMITSVVPLANLPSVFESLRGPNMETKVHVDTMAA